MGAPMLPRPMNPMVAMSQYLEESQHLEETQHLEERRREAYQTVATSRIYSSFAISMSLATVFMLRAVPVFAAGIFNLEPAIRSP
jgi:hypothetical protein